MHLIFIQYFKFHERRETMQGTQKKKKSIFTWLFAIIILFVVTNVIFSFLEFSYTKSLISEGFVFLRNPDVVIISVMIILTFALCLGGFIYFSAKTNEIIGLLIITSLIFVSVLIYSGLKETKEEVLFRNVTQLQSSAIEKSYGFEKSDVNNEISAIIQEKDYEKLKTLFTRENINGLSKDEIFEKIIIVKNINDNKIHKAFDKIYADRFVSIKEYSDFKSFVIEQLSNNTEYKSSDVNNMKAASLL